MIPKLPEVKMTKILPCNCRNSYQDAHYGLGLRVHNWAPKSTGNKVAGWRCTVCHLVKQHQTAVIKASKKVSAKKEAKAEKKRKEHGEPIKGRQR